MKVYTTKYALTAGIEVKEVERSGDSSDYVYTQMGLGLQQFVMGQTAFLTYEEATVAAREMRNKKMSSLKRQLARVSGLLFPTKESENLK